MTEIEYQIMEFKKATIIVSVYDNVDFLKLILDSLKQQSIQSFEIIISEDGNNPKMKEFIETYSFSNDYKHLTLEDIGWRKNTALNNAIRNASGEWLIFIDGDCVLHPRFVEMHLRYAKDNVILSGRRVKLDEKSSKELQEKSPESIRKMQYSILKKLFFGKGDVLYIEEGFFVSPKSLLFFIPKLRKFNYLLGCNMSFSKKAIYSINGFDETYINPSVGEDTDIAWRFKALGYKMKSLRNLAVQYHLYHPKNWTTNKENKDKMLLNQKQNKYFCEQGLVKVQ